MLLPTSFSCYFFISVSLFLKACFSSLPASSRLRRHPCLQVAHSPWLWSRFWPSGCSVWGHCVSGLKIASQRQTGLAGPQSSQYSEPSAHQAELIVWLQNPSASPQFKSFSLCSGMFLRRPLSVSTCLSVAQLPRTLPSAMSPPCHQPPFSPHLSGMCLQSILCLVQGEMFYTIFNCVSSQTHLACCIFGICWAITAQ